MLNGGATTTGQSVSKSVPAEATDGILHPLIHKRVPEAAYLIVPNAERYRVIMHFFYGRYKQQQHRLKVREVWRYVAEVYEPTYTIEQCSSDLRALVEYRALAHEQDRDIVGSVEEWRNRDQVYDITPLAIRFEEVLEQHRIEGGRRANLDPTLIESIFAGMRGLHRTLQRHGADAKWERKEVDSKIWRPWNDIYRQFSDLTTSTNAYHHALRDAQRHDLNEITILRLYKGVLIENLSGFINELIDVGDHLRELLAGWLREDVVDQLAEVLANHQARYYPDAAHLHGDHDTRARHLADIMTLVSWFQSDGGMEALRRTTANAIDTVVRVTARITDRMRAGSSRRDDLIRLARAFADCPDLASAHTLASSSLGCPEVRHIQGTEQAGLMTDSRSVWEQPAHEVPMRRITRGRRPRPRPDVVANQSVAQAALVREEMEERHREQAAWDALFATGAINVGDLTVDDPGLRDLILEALDSCLVSSDLRGIASDGSAIQLVPPDPGTPPRISQSTRWRCYDPALSAHSRRQGGGAAMRAGRMSAEDQRRSYTDLIDQVAITAENDEAAFRRTRVHITDVRRWFADRTGWSVLLTHEMVRLIKNPAFATAAQGFRWAKSTLDYELFVWLLWYEEVLETSQFVCSELVRELEAQMGGTVGAGHFTWDNRLVEGGTSIFYAGDFDLRGIEIALALEARFPSSVRLWRMGEEDHLEAISLGEAGPPLSAADEARLRKRSREFAEMLRRGTAHQEVIAHRLCEDILAPPD